jgi:hypothetical protein
VAVRDGKEWRFAATSDVLKLRFVVDVVKLRRHANLASDALLPILGIPSHARAVTVSVYGALGESGLHPHSCDRYLQVIGSSAIAGYKTQTSR